MQQNITAVNSGVGAEVEGGDGMTSMAFRLPKAYLDGLDALAAKSHRNRAGMLRQIIEDALHVAARNRARGAE